MESDLGFKIVSIDELEGKYKLPKYVEPEFLETLKGRDLNEKDIFLLYQSWLSMRDYLTRRVNLIKEYSYENTV